MKRIFILFIIAIFESQSYPCPIAGKEKSEADSIRTVTISFAGDLMCHTPQMEFARISKDSFDFKPEFREVKKYLSASDLTVGNLETTISGKKKNFSGYPLFNSPDEYLDALKDAGFDLLFTANNHCLDRGKSGLERTIEKIHSLGMISTGTFKSQQDRDSIRILEIKGIKLAFLAYTYGLNGNYISKNEKYLVNVIDTNLIKHDILAARKQNVEVIIVYFHFGEEYQREPVSFQKEMVKFTIGCGADLIIGSHPHVMQPLEYFISDKNKIGEGIVSYSLGNFISNQRKRYSDCGVILNISIKKNIANGIIRLANVSIIPTWVFKNKFENKNEFIILPADSTMSKEFKFLSEDEKAQLRQADSDTRKNFNLIENHHYLPLVRKSD